MHEILPGVFCWTTFHEGIKYDVQSYYVEATDPAILIDPRVPGEGIDCFEKHLSPRHAYLTNRHHYRHCDQFVDEFDTEIWCHREGLHEFTEGQEVSAFDHGDELPGRVLALEVGVLCPEETALHIPHAEGILAIGDAIIRYGGELGFVPDRFMGDDPEEVKRGLKEVFLGHLDQKFDHLLFAHGEPLIGGAREALREFLERI